MWQNVLKYTQTRSFTRWYCAKRFIRNEPNGSGCLQFVDCSLQSAHSRRNNTSPRALFQMNERNNLAYSKKEKKMGVGAQIIHCNVFRVRTSASARVHEREGERVSLAGVSLMPFSDATKRRRSWHAAIFNRTDTSRPGAFGSLARSPATREITRSLAATASAHRPSTADSQMPARAGWRR